MRLRIMALIGFLLSGCVLQSTQIFPTADLPASPSATAELNLDKIRSAVIADLSDRLSLEPNLILVTSVESQLWPDTSLGCPRSGAEYAQQTVPGYRLQLEADGVGYVYHTDTANTIILCAEADPISFPVTPGEIDDAEPWMPAD